MSNATYAQNKMNTYKSNMLKFNNNKPYLQKQQHKYDYPNKIRCKNTHK